MRSKEAAGNVHLIIVTAEQEIGAKIEVLLAAVAGNLGGESRTQDPPKLIFFLPGLDFFNFEAGHR
ncbi:hypothetical protein [Microvirga sp. VF16]|uniref:hypothetical protein n=1 Tax=Microvirga sp. VF16 TaxID=2807101 RepID=UPI00193EBBC7|nr:hypothetical protein [Microvirga sp. VF16]QRM33707.1 hypothetical protein JO965_37555 [Microvirga sp. VF16]